MYAKCLPTFNKTLQVESFSTGAFDNYNKLLPTKNQIDGKASTNHIRTMYLLKKDRLYEIPVNTIMLSPAGILFSILSCMRHDDDLYLLHGVVLDTDEYHKPDSKAADGDHTKLTTGFLWPEIGWQIQTMLRFVKRSELMYAKQIVPTPRLSWIEKDVEIAQTVLDKGFHATEPKAEGSEPLTTQCCHNYNLLAR